MGLKSTTRVPKAGRHNDNRQQQTVIEGAEGVQTGHPEFEKVVWYREPHLRKLYFMLFFLFIASVTRATTAIWSALPNRWTPGTPTFPRPATPAS
jgi:hypothetical protein